MQHRRVHQEMAYSLPMAACGEKQISRLRTRAVILRGKRHLRVEGILLEEQSHET